MMQSQQKLPSKEQLNCAEQHLQISTSISKKIEANRIGDLEKRIGNAVILRANHSTPPTRYLIFESFLDGCFRRSNPPCWYRPKCEMSIAWLIRQLEKISDRFRTFTIITKLMRQNPLFEQERRCPTEETDLSTADERAIDERAIGTVISSSFVRRIFIGIAVRT
jgi:hypothetical protein